MIYIVFLIIIFFLKFDFCTFLGGCLWCRGSKLFPMQRVMVVVMLFLLLRNIVVEITMLLQGVNTLKVCF
jgi:hypothetical protein